jgi:hypothetical protein
MVHGAFGTLGILAKLTFELVAAKPFVKLGYETHTTRAADHPRHLMDGISHNDVAEAEFWTLFNKPSYFAVKAITGPANLFRDVYTKMCKAAMGRS